MKRSQRRAIIDRMRAVSVARALWISWAIVVWNVVFDQFIVVASRRYIQAATFAAYTFAPYPRMDDWMRPAVMRGFWTATGAAAAILLVGFILIGRGTRRDRARTPH